MNNPVSNIWTKRLSNSLGSSPDVSSDKLSLSPNIRPDSANTAFLKAQFKPNLKDVMSEQLAEKLIQQQTNEMLENKVSNQNSDTNFLIHQLSNQFGDAIQIQQNSKSSVHEPIIPIIQQQPSTSVLNAFPSKTDEKTDNDEILAKLLQQQYDADYNRELKKAENKINKKSSTKVITSYKNYEIEMGSSYSSLEDELNNYNSDELEDLYFPEIDNYQKDTKLVGKQLKWDNERQEYISKHDLHTCSRNNAAKMESFPLSIKTGMISDLKVSNKIYNSLRVHANEQKKIQARLHENKDHSTAEHAVDARTRLILHKWVNNNILEEVNGIVSIGKEAIILHAKGGSETPKNQNNIFKPIPENIAIKVFKTTMSEFRNRDKYIADDFRFQDRFKKLNSKKLAYLWAEKEMRNLERLRAANIPAPEVVLLRKHVLLMRFIGSVNNGGSAANGAPKLNEILHKLKFSTQVRAFEQVVEIMQNMFKKAKLVHGDLSPYNLLWHENKVWVIDTAQAVEPHHPFALEFLYRDCCNICKYFGGKLQIQQVMNPISLFFKVSKLDLEGIEPEQVTFQEFDYNGHNATEFLGKIEELKQRAKERLEKKKKGNYIEVDDEYIDIDQI